MSSSSTLNLPKRSRCAIYTRKSSEEGLDMEFNSLDAQREACEAYVTSQKAEGWVAIRERFDDGGFSGGSLERPALKQLLQDVEAGLIDVIVVYKIDRLYWFHFRLRSKLRAFRISPIHHSPWRLLLKTR